MYTQPSLITLANDSEVLRPGGVQIQRQFYRDKAAPGSGTYKAMDENGQIEIIGGPGVGPAGAMSVWTKIGDVVNVVADTFYSFFNGSPSAVEADIQYKYNGLPITLSKFSIRVITNTSATPATFTVRVNGVDTSITITVPAGATGIFEDLVNTASIATDDLISIEITGVTVGNLIFSQTHAIATQ